MNRATGITGITLNATVYTVAFKFDHFQNLGGAITFATQTLATAAAQGICTQLNATPYAGAIAIPGNNPQAKAGANGNGSIHGPCVQSFYVVYANSAGMLTCVQAHNTASPGPGVVPQWGLSHGQHVSLTANSLACFPVFTATGSGPALTVFDALYGPI